MSSNGRFDDRQLLCWTFECLFLGLLKVKLLCFKRPLLLTTGLPHLR
nr:MAG TPA: hypothetical protein [Caudoviricetes sp.]